MKCLIIATLVSFYFSGCLYAQDSTGEGIRFEEGLTWHEILKKARDDRKCIFVDCFTTWCGPCRLMDKEIFTRKAVGDYVNAYFIAVKLQMDKSDKDSKMVKRWYKDAGAIQEEYGIPAYPTYLFFSPDGKLQYRDLGYKNAEDFLVIVKKAKSPTASLQYQRFYSLVNAYQHGQKDYNVIPALIDTARRLGQLALVDSMANNYMNHLESMKEEELYTKGNLTFIAAFIPGSQSRCFHLFYPAGWKVDSVIGIKGYAESEVDRISKKRKLIRLKIDWVIFEALICSPQKE
jgi:thioredoxin-related protein